MHTFLLSAIGPKQVEQVNISLSFLKRYVREEILVIYARSQRIPKHDQLLKYEDQSKLSDQELAFVIKASLLELVGSPGGLYCYIDPLVLPVSAEAGSVFKQRRSLIDFGSLHGLCLRDFSKVSSVGADHFSAGTQRLVEQHFDLSIPDDWPLVSNDIFIFDRDAAEFMRAWGNVTEKLFAEPDCDDPAGVALWGTLWKFGLEDSPSLPESYNQVVRLNALLKAELEYDHGRFGYRGNLVKFLNCKAAENSNAFRQACALL